MMRIYEPDLSSPHWKRASTKQPPIELKRMTASYGEDQCILSCAREYVIENDLYWWDSSEPAAVIE